MTNNALTHDEYEARATPRLAAMDALAPHCAFDKWEWERTPEEQRAWDRHERLLREQLDDEVRAGL